jgi:hypothetical protein
VQRRPYAQSVLILFVLVAAIGCTKADDASATRVAGPAVVPSAEMPGVSGDSRLHGDDGRADVGASPNGATCVQQALFLGAKSVAAAVARCTGDDRGGAGDPVPTGPLRGLRGDDIASGDPNPNLLPIPDPDRCPDGDVVAGDCEPREGSSPEDAVDTPAVPFCPAGQVLSAGECLKSSTIIKVARAMSSIGSQVGSAVSNATGATSRRGAYYTEQAQQVHQQDQWREACDRLARYGISQDERPEECLAFPEPCAKWEPRTYPENDPRVPIALILEFQSVGNPDVQHHFVLSHERSFSFYAQHGVSTLSTLDGIVLHKAKGEWNVRVYRGGSYRGKTEERGDYLEVMLKDNSHPMTWYPGDMGTQSFPKNHIHSIALKSSSDPRCAQRDQDLDWNFKDSPIPFIVRAFRDPVLQRPVDFIRTVADLGAVGWHGTISELQVYPGPNFKTGDEVGFYRHERFNGICQFSGTSICTEEDMRASYKAYYSHGASEEDAERQKVTSRQRRQAVPPPDPCTYSDWNDVCEERLESKAKTAPRLTVRGSKQVCGAPTDNGRDADPRYTANCAPFEGNGFVPTWPRLLTMEDLKTYNLHDHISSIRFVTQ